MTLRWWPQSAICGECGWHQAVTNGPDGWFVQEFHDVECSRYSRKGEKTRIELPEIVPLVPVDDAPQPGLSG